MLLKPTVPGLCAMLQTIYETESCFSSDSTTGSNMPSTGECVQGGGDRPREKPNLQEVAGAGEGEGGINTEMRNACVLHSLASSLNLSAFVSRLSWRCSGLSWVNQMFPTQH